MTFIQIINKNFKLRFTWLCHTTCVSKDSSENIENKDKQSTSDARRYQIVTKMLIEIRKKTSIS